MATSARLEELKQKFHENPRRYFAPLANEHRKLGDLDQAINLCRAHLPQQPQHVSGHIVLAQALFEAGNPLDARATFELALDLDPENLIALRFLGDIARTQGEMQAARSWYERVLDADPRNEEIARLIRELDGATPSPRAAAVESPRASEPAPAAIEPNEALAAEPPPVPIEDLAVAWQHEVAALDPTSAEAPAEPPAMPDSSAVEPPIQAESFAAESYTASDTRADSFAPPHQEPYAGQSDAAAAESVEPTFTTESQFDTEPSFTSEPGFALPEIDLGHATIDAPAGKEPNEAVAEPYSEPVAAAPDEPVAAYDEPLPPIPEPSAEIREEPLAHEYAASEAASEPRESAPDESWSEPDEEFVATVPEVPSEAPPAPPVFREIDYSMFEAVADDEPVAASAREVPPEASQPSAPADDWFAPPHEPHAEPYVPEASSESAFDLDAAFQQVLPNKDDADEEHLAAEPSSETDYAALTRGDWTVDGSDARPDAAPESDAVDDAFATLDEMTGSLGEENAGNAAPGEESYVAPDYIAAPHHVDALIGRTPDTGVPAIEEAPAAFVTETMAELYLQQGFRDEALAVYRQLLAMNPDDAVLAERVRALEAPEPAPAQARGQSDRGTAPRADAAGQSVRAFLSVFARRRAPMRRRSDTPADMPPPPQEETALSALLGAPQSTDVGSAAVLAGAFAPNAETEVLPGRPTRAAAGELSLGDVFGGGGESSGGRAASFDEFFGTGSADRAAPSPLDEEGSDMLQFTAWLEGLKKK